MIPRLSPVSRYGAPRPSRKRLSSGPAGRAPRPDRAAHRGDDRRVIVRDDPTAFARVQVRRSEAVEEAPQLRTGGARAAPADDQRPARRPEEIDGGAGGDRIGQQFGWTLR